MITDLSLRQFRSYLDSSFEFGEGVNIIVGPNGSGKTNLLEAILVLSKGSSYRASDQDLITHNKQWSTVEAHINDGSRILKLTKIGDSAQKEFEIGGTKLKRLNMNRTLPIVVFEPNNLQLLTQSPDLRRNFLDDVIEQTKPLFGDIRRKYKRTLAQRNSLLKQEFNNDQMFIWNVRLSELGSQLVEYRQMFVDDNREPLAKLYTKLSGKKHNVDLKYQANINSNNYSSMMIKALEDRIDKDRLRGFTTIGPHRDDLVPLIDGYALSVSASRGETRTMLLALKLLELEAIETARNTKPILLLDDVFSELDGARRQALTKYLQSHQTFITTTDADIVVNHFLNNCTVIPLN